MTKYTTEKRHSPLTTVLQVSNNYFIAGGSDRYFFELSQAQRSSGMHVVPFSALDDRNQHSEWSDYFPPALKAESPKLSDAFRFVYSKAARRSLKKLLLNVRVDIAHLHIYYGRLTASILPILKKERIPIVQTVHDFKLLCAVYSCLRNGVVCEACEGNRFWKASRYRCNRGSSVRSLASTLESYASKSLGSHSAVDHYVAVSEFQRERLIANRICPSDRISTIHNFVDVRKYVPATGPGAYACYFGRIEKLKGIPTLLECMRGLPNVQLKLVGDGNYQVECRNILQTQGIKNVEVCGFQTGAALERLVRGSFCTILPTEAYENCPMSVLESFAYARPVIGTAIGGIPELVKDGTDGYLIPVANPEAMRAAISRLAFDTELSVGMGLAGRRKVEEHFNLPIHMQKVQAVYNGLVA